VYSCNNVKPELTREQLVELVTREVIRFTGGEPEPPGDKTGLPAALVIGSADKLPSHIAAMYDLHTLQEMADADDVARFEKIYIMELTLSELADIALGRDVHAAGRAVIAGLLSGKEIFLLDCALGFRRNSATVSRAFIQMLEGYVRTLQSFGITLVSGQTPVDKYAPGDLPEGIVTEGLAMKMAADSQNPLILLKKGTVITPSAKDVFLHAGKIIEFV